ncbi:MAG: ATP-grasp domain-containing protein [Pseudomonadota bacterium]
MRPEAPFLIAAVSGRALAASARRAGHGVVVLDFFNDLDTRACAIHSRACAGPGGFDAGRLLRAAQALCPPEACAGLVYGAGFEGRPGLLARLARGRRLWGNTPETLALVKDPGRFFPLLERLEIPHPETRLRRPPVLEGWLRKQAGGAGGGHVAPAGDKARRGRGRTYYQRWISGRSCSALFLADGREARLVGFSEQRTADEASAPYLYGGAVSHARLAARIREAVEAILARLVPATGLRGLNGLDFLVDPLGQVRVLEVNPRPPATLDLYDADCRESLFDGHLRACRGELPREPLVRRVQIRAHAIVYAPAPVRIPRGWRWPAWCSDLPRGGLRIPPGAPVCTVHSRGATPSAAWRLAARRKARIAAALGAAAA